MGAIVVGACPPPRMEKNQQAFATVFAFIPRIVLAASLIAFWAGEFANSYTIGPPQTPHRRPHALDPHHRFHRHRTGGRHCPSSSPPPSMAPTHQFIPTLLGPTRPHPHRATYASESAYEVLASSSRISLIRRLRRRNNLPPNLRLRNENFQSPFLLQLRQANTLTSKR